MVPRNPKDTAASVRERLRNASPATGESFHVLLTRHGVERRATRHSLAENAVSRFKALVGVKLASRDLERQQAEVPVKSQVLNRMAALGMPRSERVPVG